MSVEDDEQVTAAGKAAFEQRRLGNAFPGIVDLRHFDEGIVRTLDAVIINHDGASSDPDSPDTPDGEYYIKVASVRNPPGKPGIPVTFAYPEDMFRKHILPCIVVRRDDISANMSRWHPGRQTYCVPAPGALPVSVKMPDGRTITRFNKTQTVVQAEPIDFIYTISIFGRHREGVTGSLETNELLRYVLSRFNAYGPLEVYDSVGDRRLYEVFREGVAGLDDLPEVTGRVIGFAVTLRVEGEWDLTSPDIHQTVTKIPSFNGPNPTLRVGFKEG